MDSNQPLDSNFEQGLHLSGLSLDYLKETAKWSKFLGIVGFVMTGLILFVFLMVFLFLGASGLGNLGSEELAAFGAIGVSGFLFYALIIVVFYFIPSLFLFRFGKNMQVAIRTEDSELMQTSFGNIKSFFKFLGILTIIFLALYGIIILFTILFGGLAAFAG